MRMEGAARPQGRIEVCIFRVLDNLTLPGIFFKITLLKIFEEGSE